jgi:hypothetical protein
MDVYPMGDPDQWIEDTVKDAMRPIEQMVKNFPVKWDSLDVPPSIRNHPNISEGQVEGVVASMNANNSRPSFIEVVDINGCFAVRVEYGKQVKLITKAPNGGHNTESPIDFELIGRMGNEIQQPK